VGRDRGQKLSKWNAKKSQIGRARLQKNHGARRQLQVADNYCAAAPGSPEAVGSNTCGSDRAWAVVTGKVLQVSAGARASATRRGAAALPVPEIVAGRGRGTARRICVPD